MREHFYCHNKLKKARFLFLNFFARMKGLLCIKPVQIKADPSTTVGFKELEKMLRDRGPNSKITILHKLDIDKHLRDHS